MTTLQQEVFKLLRQSFTVLQFDNEFSEISETFSKELQKLNLSIDETETIQLAFEDLLYEIEKLETTDAN